MSSLVGGTIVWSKDSASRGFALRCVGAGFVLLGFEKDGDTRRKYHTVGCLVHGCVTGTSLAIVFFATGLPRSRRGGEGGSLCLLNSQRSFFKTGDVSVRSSLRQ